MNAMLSDPRWHDGSSWRDDPPVAPRPAVQPPARLNVGHAFANVPAPLDFVLPGMKAASVGSIVAAGATGKSMLALQLAIALAGGKDTLELCKASDGWTPGCADILYLSGEDPADILASRLHAIGQHLDDEQRERVHEHLHIWPLSGLGARLDDYEWRKAIEGGADGKRLVILDTLRRFHEKDENDGGEMSKLISTMEQICSSTGAGFLFLHHTSKASALGGTAGEQQASRGSSVLTDNVRWQGNMSTMCEKEAARAGVDDSVRRKFVRLSFPKINYSAPISDLWFRRAAGGVLLPEPNIAAALAGGGSGGKGKGHGKARSAAGAAAPQAKAVDGGDVPLMLGPAEPARDIDGLVKGGCAGGNRV
ncbi:MAG: helicase RepA family protein [Solirubrobacteraceae bacterium]